MAIDGACRATRPVNFLGMRFDALDFESALDAAGVRASPRAVLALNGYIGWPANHGAYGGAM